MPELPRTIRVSPQISPMTVSSLTGNGSAQTAAKVNSAHF